MKNKSYVITSFLLSLMLSIPLQSSPESLDLNEFSHTILHLFYVIKHLDPTVNFIQQAVESKKIEQHCLQDLLSYPHLLKAEKVKIVFAEMVHTHSFNPLFKMWEGIRQFKYGTTCEEKNILLDFSKLCFVAYQSLFVSLHSKNMSSEPTILPEELDSLEEIDALLEAMETYSLFYLLKQMPPQRIADPSPFHTMCSKEFCASFALRYYLIRRLKQAFASLTNLHEKKVPLFTDGITALGFREEDLMFTHESVNHYFHALQKEKTLTPLFGLLQQFQSFEYIKSPSFTKEFLLLLCIIFKDINLDRSRYRTTEIEEELRELSAEDLLSLIDTLHDGYKKDRPFSIAGKKKMPQSHSLSELVSNEYGVSPELLASLVFQRYYYIQRLSDAVKNILKQSSSSPHSLFKTTLLLKPLSLVWNEFTAYKEIFNQKLVDDLTKEIFILSQTVSHKKKTASLTPCMSDFKASAETNKIIARFYLIKRLKHTVALLQTLHEKNLFPTSFPTSFHASAFQEKPVQCMIQSIEATQSLRPLFVFWHGIIRYKYIDNEAIGTEFAGFLTHLITSSTTQHKAIIPIEEIQEMPLEDILNLLDILVEELPLFLKENEIGSGIGVQAWIKKYWLVAPLKMAIFGISVYLMYKGIIARPEHRVPAQ